MFMTLVTSISCATADILTKLLQQCFLFFIVVVISGNSHVSVYRTIGPTLVVNMPEMAHDWFNKSILFYSILFYSNKSP